MRAKKSLLEPVAMATVHTLRGGGGAWVDANQALPLASPVPFSVVGGKGYINIAGQWKRMEKG